MKVSIDGVALDVAVDGDIAAGLPIVFLHEGLGCIALWRSFPQTIAAALGDVPTIVYSRGGYGHSDPVELPRPATYMHDEADRVLPQLLDALAIDRCILVGHSDGASIALLAAGGDRTLAERIAGLALLAPHVFVEDLSVMSIDEARAAYLHGDLRGRLARYHDDVDNAFWGWNDVWLSAEFRHWDITDRLAAITCPVAVIQGAADPYGTLAQVDAIAETVSGPVTTTVVPDVGHAPHLEAPETTTAAVRGLVEHAMATSGGRR